ncbi:hypothetical protein C4869_24250, partial [Salmonella enterica subsp. enterica serovar Anatum]
ILAVLDGSHDLGLKMAHQHARLVAVSVTPTDRHVLRTCPSTPCSDQHLPRPQSRKAQAAVTPVTVRPPHNPLNKHTKKKTKKKKKKIKKKKKKKKVEINANKKT